MSEAVVLNVITCETQVACQTMAAEMTEVMPQIVEWVLVLTIAYGVYRVVRATERFEERET